MGSRNWRSSYAPLCQGRWRHEPDPNQHINKTGQAQVTPASGRRGTISVPIQIKRCSGRKRVTLPNGETGAIRPWEGEVKSLKGHRSEGGVDSSYGSRMVNLNTLAPDLVAAVLDDAVPNSITLSDLAVDPQGLREEQGARSLCRPCRLGIEVVERKRDVQAATEMRAYLRHDRIREVSRCFTAEPLKC